jgi:hypothetical protein
LPELKLWLVNTIGLVHRPLHGVLPEQAGQGAAAVDADLGAVLARCRCRWTWR